jgi:hypothetical protein
MKKTFCITLLFILSYYFLLLFIASCNEKNENNAPKDNKETIRIHYVHPGKSLDRVPVNTGFGIAKI